MYTERMTDRVFRHYTQSDKDICLALFDANIPKYFSAHERKAFENFLDALPAPYYVVEEDGVVVASGGSAPHKSTNGALMFCWGMVDPQKKKTGLGSFLLRENLDRLNRKQPVFLNTSQHARDFYEKFGFKTSRVVRDGYDSGMDLYEMRLAPLR